MNLDLSKGFGRNDEHYNYLKVLDELKDKYQKIFGERPKFDIVRHRKLPVFRKEIEDKINEYMVKTKVKVA